MRLIDADELTSVVFEGCNKRNMTMTTEVVIDVIRRMPTIVELVRCEKCKHYSVEGFTTLFGWCNAKEHPTDEDDFCSFGERRVP